LFSYSFSFIPSMRTLLFVCLLFAGTAVCQVYGQVLSGLEGTVRDGATGGVVPGASVLIKENGRGTAADAEGRYSLQNLASGTYTLVITSIGYKPARITVTLTDGQTLKKDITLKPDIQSLIEVKVEAKRIANSETAILDERRTAVAIKDGISAENITRTASITVTQAVQKVAGVATRDDRSISVRGLTERNIVVQLNGSRLSSADPLRSGGVPLDILPAQLLDNVTIQKTFTPDNPGDATAALIELKTRSLPDTFSVSLTAQTGFNDNVGPVGRAMLFQNGQLGFFGQHAARHRLSQAFIDLATVRPSTDRGSITGSGGYAELGGYTSLYRQVIEGRNSEQAAQQAYRINALQEEIDPYLAPTPQRVPLNQIYSFAVSNMFNVQGQKRLGILVGVNYLSRTEQVVNGVNNRFQVDPRAVTPNNVQLTSQFNFREDAGTHAIQYGGIGIVTYRFNKFNEVSANYLTNRGYESNGILLSSIRQADNLFGYQLSTSIRRFNTMQLRGEHKLDLAGYRPLISWNASTSTTRTELPDFRNSFLLADTNGRFVNGVILPEYYQVFNLTRFFRNLEETNYNANVDFTLPVLETGTLTARLKTGMWYLRRERNYNQQLLVSPTNYASDIRNTWLNYLEGIGGGLQRVRGNLNNWLTPDYIGISEPNSRDGSLVPGYNYYLQTGGSSEQGPGAYNALQRVTAAYLMADVEIGPLFRLTGGIRVEDTDTRAVVDTAGVGSNITSVEQYLTNFTVDQQEMQWLPSAIATFRIKTNMNLRVAYSQTLNRPEILELAPVRTYDASQLSFVSGNNQLRNAAYANLDLRWEYFPRRGEVFAVSGFTKRIENGLERVFLPAPKNELIDNLLPLASVSFRNNPSIGRVHGIELEAVKSLSFLSPRLNAVKVGLNAMLAYSETRITQAEYYAITQFDRSFDTRRPIFEQPNVVFNANVGYDWAEKQFSANLYLNYTGRRLVEIYTDGTPNIYEHPAPQLDFIFSKGIGKRWRIRGFAKNLLDGRTDYIYQKNPEQATYGIFNQINYRRQFTRGRNVALGISYSF
jgi:TonB-dependent receptor